MDWKPSARHIRDRNAVAIACGVPPYAMVSHGRRRPIAQARQLGFWIMRRCWPNMSYQMIGAMFGGRDHSTVIYGCEQIENRRDRDLRFREFTDQLAADIKAKHAPVPPLLRVLPPKPRQAVAITYTTTVRFAKNDFTEGAGDGTVSGATKFHASIAKGSAALAAAIAR